MERKYSYRHLARIIIEAESPIAIGAGEGDIFSDALVARDVNGLPYIPGTSIAGVLRSMIGEEHAKSFFGSQDGAYGGNGSEVIFTEAKILDSDGNVVDNTIRQDLMEDSILRACLELPIRQHVRIGDRGTGVKGGKFDECVVYAGTRFGFEIEMVSTAAESSEFQLILNKIQDRTLRIGGGTRSGFGKIKVVQVQTASLNLRDKQDLELYLSKSSDLSQPWSGWSSQAVEELSSQEYDEYVLELTPCDFFLFSSGYAGITPVKEQRIVWNDGKAQLMRPVVLAPATSIKGALSHRIAYHWNKEKGLFAGNTEAKVCEENPAVRELFGYQDKDAQKRGQVMFSDLYLSELDGANEKVQYHVKIDRFTGGVISGPLFQEKIVYGAGTVFKTTISVSKSVDPEYVRMFEKALLDVANGLLPLGGGVNRGHGMFTGKIVKNGIAL